jgi:hypothetical protein
MRPSTIGISIVTMSDLAISHAFNLDARQQAQPDPNTLATTNVKPVRAEMADKNCSSVMAGLLAEDFGGPNRDHRSKVLLSMSSSPPEGSQTSLGSSLYVHGAEFFQPFRMRFP